MAQYAFYLAKRYADDMVYGGRKCDYRPKSKNVSRGDVIQYIVIDEKRTLICHPIADKKFKVRYVSDYDPRVPKGYDLIEVEEIEPEWGEEMM